MGAVAFCVMASFITGLVSYALCKTEVAQRIAAAIGFDGEPEWRQ